MPYLILDLETVPIANAAAFLPLEDIEPDGRLKDPVKIAEDIAKKQQAKIDSAALDLDLARICAIGYQRDGHSAPRLYALRTEEEEADQLAQMASVLADRQIVTFNGRNFDLPLLMRRARYLGVSFPRINLDRYKSPHLDLYEELTLKGAVKAHPLRWYFRRHGWTDLLEADPLVNGGADVGQACAQGRWSDVEAHLRSDVVGTKRLAQWLGLVPADGEATF